MGSIPFHSTVPPNPLLSPRLQDVSCCLPALAPSASRQVLSALLPLVPLNSDFARHLLLLLRKQLVAPEPRARALAVFGFCAALHRRHLPIEPGAHADAVMALRSACSISPALQSRTFGELAPLLATQHSEASTQIQGGRPEDSDTCQENESARVSLMATILEHLHSLSPPTDPALVDPKRAVNPHTAHPGQRARSPICDGRAVTATPVLPQRMFGTRVVQVEKTRCSPSACSDGLGDVPIVFYALRLP